MTRAPRARALLLLYWSGLLAIVAPTAQLAFHFPSGIVTLLGVVEAVAVVATICALTWLAFSRRAPKPAALEPAEEADFVFEAQERMGRYVREASALAWIVPALLAVVGLLLLALLALMDRSYQSNLLRLVLGAGYVALSLGGAWPFFALIREGQRLRRIEARVSAGLREDEA